jgi:hypothetical protein
MAITFPRAFLTHKKPSAINISMEKADGVAASPFDLSEQVYEWVGERWLAEISFPPMNRANAEAWIGWLTSLRGAFGSFTMGDPNGLTARGTASGSPTASGTIRARTITVAGGSGTLLVGDWISFSSNRWLHKVTADVTLGGSVSVEIWPALRAPLSGSAMAVTNPMGRWRLAEKPSWSIDQGGTMYHIAPVRAVEDMRMS